MHAKTSEIQCKRNMLIRKKQKQKSDSVPKEAVINKKSFCKQ